MNAATTTNSKSAAVTVTENVPVSHKVRNRIAAVLAFLTCLIVASPAHATPPPSLLDGAENSFFSSISGFLTGNLLPLVFVLAAVVIGAGMLIRYGRKAVSS